MVIAFPISVIVIALGVASHAVADPLTCPSSEMVAIAIAAPGWVSISSIIHPYGAPVLGFVNVRTDGFDTRCMYRVKGSGVLTMAYHAVCKPAQGDWKEQGTARQCDSSAPEQCVLDYDKKP